MNRVVVVPRSMNRNDAVIASSAMKGQDEVRCGGADEPGPVLAGLHEAAPEEEQPGHQGARPAISVAMFVPPRSGSTTV